MIKLTNGLMADISTIRLDRLQKLPRIEGIRLWPSMGAGCYLDPPGYPSYFLRGYEGRNNSGYAIQIGDAAYHVDGDFFNQRSGWSETAWRKHGAPEDREERMKWLYTPLPFDNPRVEEWMRQLFRHLRHCYRIEGEKEIVIFPTQSTEFTKQGLFVAKPEFDKRLPYFFQHLSPESQALLKEMEEKLTAEAEASVKVKKEALEAERAKVCTIDRHIAVMNIRSIYPDYAPDLDFVEEAKNAVPTNWWEVHAELPDPCPLGSGHPPHMRFVCQFCGRKSDGIPDPETGQVHNGAKDGNKDIYAGYSYHREVAREAKE